MQSRGLLASFYKQKIETLGDQLQILFFLVFSLTSLFSLATVTNPGQKTHFSSCALIHTWHKSIHYNRSSVFACSRIFVQQYEHYAVEAGVEFNFRAQIHLLFKCYILWFAVPLSMPQCIHFYFLVFSFPYKYILAVVSSEAYVLYTPS